MISVCTLSAREWDFREIAFSLSNQTIKPLWVLIDFLYDKNYLAVRKLIKEFGIDIIHRPPVSCGYTLKQMREIANNRNYAASLANSDIIFLDDYTQIGHTFVAHHLNVILKGQISCGKMFFEGYNKCSTESDHRSDLLGHPLDPVEVLGAEWTYTGNLGIPKKVFDDLGGFDEYLNSQGEDCDFGLRAKALGYQIMYNPTASSINLYTKNIPYCVNFGHLEPHPIMELMAKPYKYIENPSLLTSVNIIVKNGYYHAICKKCGASLLLEPTKYILDKQSKKEYCLKNN